MDLTLALLIMAYIGLGVFFIVLSLPKNVSIRTLLVNPGFVIGFTLSYTYFIQPALMISSHTYFRAEGYSPEAMGLSLCAFTLFGFFYIVGYKTSRGAEAFEISGGISIPGFHPLSGRFLTVAFVLLVLPSLLSLYWLWGRISTFGFNSFMLNRIVLLSGSGYYLAPLRWAQLFLYLLISHVSYWRRRAQVWPKRYVLMGILSLVVSVAGGLLAGSRTQAVTPILLSIYLLVLTKDSGAFSIRSLWKYGVVAGILITVAVMLGDVRSQIMAGSLSSVQLRREESTIFEDFSASWGVSEHMFWWFDNSEKTGLLYGKTFAAALVGWVPRSLWKSKPLGGGPALVNMRDPGIYDLSSGRPLGCNTTGLAFEAFMNFGWTGMILVGFVFGKTTGMLALYASLVKNSLQLTLWIMGFYFLAFYLIGEFFGVTASTATTIVPLLFLSLVLGLQNKQKTVHWDRLQRQSIAEPSRGDVI